MLADHKAQRVVVDGGEKVLIADHDGARGARSPSTSCWWRSGRAANTDGLRARGARYRRPRQQRTVATDAVLQTIYPNITACGDVAGPYQFTHTAAHQAWYAAVNALFGSFRRFKADYRVIPWVTFTDPEVARVGLSEQEARDEEHRAHDDGLRHRRPGSRDRRRRGAAASSRC